MQFTQTNNFNFELDKLREAIQDEYEVVATKPGQGFHFHTGRPLAYILGYEDAWLDNIPEQSIASFAGTGNPFSLGRIYPGEHVLDIGSGAGMDSMIAAHMVGPEGSIIGIDMTSAMLAKARSAAAEANIENVEFREGYAEALPVADDSIDVIISNGVLNLMPDKLSALQEMARVLKPNGRLQIGDILVQKEVPDSAKGKIDLWTG